MSIQADSVFPVRGHAISANFTCPNCAYLIKALNLNSKQSCCKCPRCSTVCVIGLSLYLVPQGVIAAQHVAPDSTVPASQRSLVAARQRSRKHRLAGLQSLGMDDPFPAVPVKRYQRGMPINSVTVVQPPESEPEPRT